MLGVGLACKRPFAEHGHVTLSIIKIGGMAKWRGGDEIGKVANFEAAADAEGYSIEITLRIDFHSNFDFWLFILRELYLLYKLQWYSEW